MTKNETNLLAVPITSTDDARTFIQFLIDNKMFFHLDDHPADIVWDVVPDSLDEMTKRHAEMWEVGNPWKYAEDIINLFICDEENECYG
tara:strand:- start:1352 stop:1618 length:267 start_codon:yes stop_codon:yes gene_type:complete